MGTGFKGGDPNAIDVTNGGPLPMTGGMAAAAKTGRGGLFGSGMSGQDVVNTMLRAAAIAQGDYTGAASIGKLLDKDKGDPEYDRFVKEAQYKAAHPDPQTPAPIVRDADAYAAMTPTQRQNYAALENIRQPHFEKGPDGMYYPVANAQPQQPLSSSDWEPYTPPTSGGAAPGAIPPFGGQGGNFTADHAWSFIAPHEGGFSSNDANGASVNYGINQAANPDVNVRGLTPDRAKQLFQQRYWDPSGAANLPPQLAAAHADTYYINPTKAQQILGQSGGNPNRYMDLREQWLGSLARSPQFSRFGKAWSNRNADLRQYLSMLGGQ